MKKYSCFIILASYSAIINSANYMFNPIDRPISVNFQARYAASLISVINQNPYNITTEHNGDDNIPNYAGSFTKCLAHNSATSVLTAEGAQNYQKLLTALSTGKQADFNAINRAPNATIKFVNPQASISLSIEGLPNSIIPIPSAPLLASDHAAADIIEVYLQAISRNVRFEDYGTGQNTDIDLFNGGSITNNAAAILTALGNAYKGPSSNGIITADLLFRGISSGDLVGPYISQFLYFSTYHLFQPIEQKQFVPIVREREFGVSWQDFIAIQNGTVPKQYDQFDFSGERYIITGKDIATAVHNDGPGQFFFNASNILLYNGFPLSSYSPYQNGNITNENPSITLAVPDIYSVLFGVCQEALKHAWAHKWRGNRKLRPEAMAGLIHRIETTNTNPYNLSSLLFNDLAGFNVLSWIRYHNEQQAFIPNNPLPINEAQTYLLGQVYPEGSPAHPSYPAGHATFAGACSTILKAFFNDQALIKDYIAPVKPDPADPTQLISLADMEGANALTVGQELDKLASNIALARDFAGVHYRSDGDEGILLGEQVALNYLRDHARIYTEQGFNGFELTKRNGQRVRITDEQIINI